jgi:hypothetical protein
MLRRTIAAICALVLIAPALSHSANLVTVESKTVYAGHQGSEIHVFVDNNVILAGIEVPLLLREITPGAFITSLKLSTRDRLALPDGPLSGVKATWQVFDTTGKCGLDGIPWDPDHIDTLPHPVPGAPMKVLFTRGAGFGEYLEPGEDATGSLLLTADIGLTTGQFEIDTTCVLTTHLNYTPPPGFPFTPAFNKGTITIVACDCPNHGDPDQDGFITPIDLGYFIDCLFACDFGGPADLCPDAMSPYLSDWDCDGFPTALDLGALIDHLFAGGDGPCDPCACDPYPDNCQ